MKTTSFNIIKEYYCPICLKLLKKDLDGETCDQTPNHIFCIFYKNQDEIERIYCKFEQEDLEYHISLSYLHSYTKVFVDQKVNKHSRLTKRNKYLSLDYVVELDFKDLPDQIETLLLFS